MVVMGRSKEGGIWSSVAKESRQMDELLVQRETLGQKVK